MTKIQTMRAELSGVALAALAVQGGDYPGFVVQAPNSMTAASRRLFLAELRARGVIGERDGLTVIGSGLVARLRAELLDSLF